MQNENDLTAPSRQPDAPMSPNRSSRGWRGGTILALALVLAVVFGIGMFSGWQIGKSNAASTGTLQPGSQSPNTGNILPPGNNPDAVREAVIAKVRPMVVQINVVTQQGGGLGSGVIVDRRGYIVTNNHVIAGAQAIQVVLSNGVKLPAQLTGADTLDDLAVVKVDASKANLTIAAIGDSSALRVGQEVLAIGNPLGITQTVTTGIVSALDRNVATGKNGPVLPGTIQTDAAINPGNSGGALVDLQGNLVGIPTLAAIDPEFQAPANGVGFAIPSNRVKFIVPQLIDTGKVTNTGRAALGIQAANVDTVIAEKYNLPIDRGVLVTNITSNGAAAKAGLKTGDIIVQIDNKAVEDISSLNDALLSKNPGDTVTVQVYRGNQQVTSKVTLGELPAS